MVFSLTVSTQPSRERYFQVFLGQWKSRRGKKSKSCMALEGLPIRIGESISFFTSNGKSDVESITSDLTHFFWYVSLPFPFFNVGTDLLVHVFSDVFLQSAMAVLVVRVFFARVPRRIRKGYRGRNGVGHCFRGFEK
jgi:hypothetical protein